MALWFGATDALDRAPYAIAAGREFMLVAKIVACALMFGLGRRLGWNRFFSAAAVLLFALSPLAAYFTRAALLDNIVTPWLIGAFFLAASPRRHLGAAAGSAVCLAVAVLTKETALLFLPALVVLLWQSSHQRNRRFVIVVFTASLVLIGIAYPIYAMIKNELVEGPGHVSLIGAIRWQLFDRVGSGSVFDSGSTASNVVHTWLTLDPWLPTIAVVAAPLGLVFRRTRAVALAFVVQVLLLLRNGYLPYPQVLAILPFAALTLAGVAGELWRSPRTPYNLLAPLPTTTRRATAVAVLGRTAMAVRRLGVLALVAWFVLVPGHAWSLGLRDVVTTDRDAGKAQALAFVQARLHPQDYAIVDDAFWVDLVRGGHPPATTIWFTKLDVDPDVKLPHGWRSVRYVLIDHQDELAVHLSGDGMATRDTKATNPTLAVAIEHSHVVASFGSGSDAIAVREVDPTATKPASARPAPKPGAKPGSAKPGSAQPGTPLAGPRPRPPGGFAARQQR